MRECVVASAHYLIDLGKMPDAALQDIASCYKFKATSRDEQITATRDLLLGSTYAEMEPIVHKIREIAMRHGHGELVVTLRDGKPVSPSK